MMRWCYITHKLLLIIKSQYLSSRYIRSIPSTYYHIISASHLITSLSQLLWGLRSRLACRCGCGRRGLWSLLLRGLHTGHRHRPTEGLKRRHRRRLSTRLRWWQWRRLTARQSWWLSTGASWWLCWWRVRLGHHWAALLGLVTASKRATYKVG